VIILVIPAKHDKSKVTTIVVPAKHNMSTVISLSLNISCHSFQTRQVYCDHLFVQYLNVIPAKQDMSKVITLAPPGLHSDRSALH
jgi:hypothetical protein